jgi:hypothetical protein
VPVSCSCSGSKSPNARSRRLRPLSFINAKPLIGHPNALPGPEEQCPVLVGTIQDRWGQDSGDPRRPARSPPRRSDRLAPVTGPLEGNAR